MARFVCFDWCCTFCCSFGCLLHQCDQGLFVWLHLRLTCTRDPWLRVLQVSNSPYTCTPLLAMKGRAEGVPGVRSSCARHSSCVSSFQTHSVNQGDLRDGASYVACLQLQQIVRWYLHDMICLLCQGQNAQFDSNMVLSGTSAQHTRGGHTVWWDTVDLALVLPGDALP